MWCVDIDVRKPNWSAISIDSQEGAKLISRVQIKIYSIFFKKNFLEHPLTTKNYCCDRT